MHCAGATHTTPKEPENACHRLPEGPGADQGLLGDDGEELVVEVGRDDVAARGAAGLAERRLGAHALVVHPVGLVNLFELRVVLGGDAEAEVAEVAVGVALAALAEDRGHGVAVGLALGVGEALEGLVDDAVEGLGELGEGAFQGLADGGGDEVVVDRPGVALADEVLGVLVGDVDALADGLAQVLPGHFHEHEREPPAGANGWRP